MRRSEQEYEDNQYLGGNRVSTAPVRRRWSLLCASIEGFLARLLYEAESQSGKRQNHINCLVEAWFKRSAEGTETGINPE
jgi:hypothetical protein